MQVRSHSAAWGVLWTLAACPFVASLVFHAIGPRAQQAAKREARPALVFDQYLVNLGRITPSPEVTAWFYFQNRSDRAVQLEKLEPSCGCLKPLLTKIPKAPDRIGPLKPLDESITFEPGERGKILLRIQTAGERPGPREYWVNVRYEDIVRRDVMLTFKVKLPEHSVVIRPRSLKIYQFSSEKTEHDVIVSDLRTYPLTVLGVDSTSTLASVVLNDIPPQADPSTRARLTISVEGHVPAGRHEATITVRTDDPRFSKLLVPVEIYGPDTPGVQQAAHHEAIGSSPVSPRAPKWRTAARPNEDDAPQ